MSEYFKIASVIVAAIGIILAFISAGMSDGGAEFGTVFKIGIISAICMLQGIIVAEIYVKSSYEN